MAPWVFDHQVPPSQRRGERFGNWKKNAKNRTSAGKRYNSPPNFITTWPKASQFTWLRWWSSAKCLFIHSESRKRDRSAPWCSNTCLVQLRVVLLSFVWFQAVRMEVAASGHRVCWFYPQGHAWETHTRFKGFWVLGFRVSFYIFWNQWLEPTNPFVWEHEINGPKYVYILCVYNILYILFF